MSEARAVTLFTEAELSSDFSSNWKLSKDVYELFLFFTIFTPLLSIIVLINIVKDKKCFS